MRDMQKNERIATASGTKKGTKSYEGKFLEIEFFLRSLSSKLRRIVSSNQSLILPAFDNMFKPVSNEKSLKICSHAKLTIQNTSFCFVRGNFHVRSDLSQTLLKYRFCDLR